MIDPYHHAHILTLRNLLAQRRSRRAESGFHAFALLALAGVLLLALQAQLPALVSMTGELLALHPLSLATGLMLISGLQQCGLRRAQRQRWSRDWLAAQPISAGIRRRRRTGLFLLWWACSLLIVLPLLAAAGASPLWPWAAAITLSSLIGQRLGDVRAPLRQRSAGRDAIRFLKSAESIRDWQIIEAGAILAPRRLSLLLLVVLLVPRGPAHLALLAVLLITIAAAIGGWLRAVAVLPQAQRWLAAQPIEPRRWLLASLWFPLQALFVAAAAGALLGAWVSGSALALLLGAIPIFLGGLHLGVAAATRAAPHRARLEAPLQMALLVAVAQSLPPAAPALWLLQMVWLLRRGLRR